MCVSAKFVDLLNQENFDSSCQGEMVENRVEREIRLLFCC